VRKLESLIPTTYGTPFRHLTIADIVSAVSRRAAQTRNWTPFRDLTIADIVSAVFRRSAQTRNWTPFKLAVDNETNG
jgi:hypothetical protein